MSNEMSSFLLSMFALVTWSFICDARFLQLLYPAAARHSSPGMGDLAGLPIDFTVSKIFSGHIGIILLFLHNAKQLVNNVILSP